MGCVALMVSACTNGGSDSANRGSESSEEPATFSVGQYRVTSLVLLSTEEGDDFNGDGEPDNNLPNALNAANAAMSEIDLSPESFNAQVEASIESGELNLLLDVSVQEGVLTVDVLTGLPWAETEGENVIDPISFEDDGEPRTRLTGDYGNIAQHFLVQTDAAILTVPFLPDEPLSDVPMVDMRVHGAIDQELEGMVTGLIPSERLVDDVLADLIPPEGVGSRSKEEMLDLLRRFAGLSAIADIELGEDERAVSSAMSLTAEPATWSLP
ncbi:MAG: hypothetical protein EA397_06240 [Deltaproteobacteria bacterium]|nr:MAG: hypothetical protein EA397_06240 [Deltaproteobacteria bacterium]